MNAGTIAALSSGISGVIVAVTALLGVFFHRHDPPDQKSGE
jgi:hypothetical protein